LRPPQISEPSRSSRDSRKRRRGSARNRERLNTRSSLRNLGWHHLLPPHMLRQSPASAASSVSPSSTPLGIRCTSRNGGSAHGSSAEATW
jgi:hypothetical protein